MILQYDGSFEGFLTLVYEVYYQKLNPSSIIKTQPKNLLLEEVLQVKTDEQKAIKVLDAIEKKFYKKHFENIINSFMCDSIEFEINLLQYIIAGFKNKKELYNINNPNVFFIDNLLTELFRHIHKMKGFTRFEELKDGTLYAKVETKFNVIYFLGKHFLKRLNNQNYIIHDINRKIAFIKNSEFIGVKEVLEFEQPTLSDDEKMFQNLWRTFFDAVSIDTRENKKCQQNYIPLLYRKYMTEFIN
ncbi:MAG: TIGR03915 family putative DNA repair protein [Campylobacterota bacterium]